MIIIRTAHKGEMLPCFTFPEGDPQIVKCVTDLASAGVTFDVVSDPAATL